VQLRPVRPEDLPACADVFYAAEDELYSRLNMPALPHNPQSLEQLFAHILATDPERCWLAHDRRGVQAFGLAVRREELHFLSFLFVRPEQQGRGMGRRLLERCLPQGAYRATCVEAIQPVSTALYASYGLAPRVPIYTLIGQPRTALAGASDPAQLESFAELARADESALLEQVDALDRQVLGVARRQEHRSWAEWGRQGFLLRAAGADGPAGYGYVQRSGRVGPVVAREASGLLPLLAELLTRATPLDAWQVLVPGPAQETLAALLQAGLRLEGPPALFCASRAGIDHARYLPATFALP
jgi:GNAT superfamily N-acetyltransferase